MSGRDAPRVTVIMIVHNGGDLIEDSIRSVLSQDYTDRELLVVDDGSTDDTVRRVEALASRHPGAIRLIGHPDGANHGMSATRRLGVASCGSPLMIFLDHDDLMNPGALGQMVARLDEHPEVGAAVGPNQRFWTDETGRETDRPRVEQCLGFDPDRIASPPGLLAVFLSDSSRVPISPIFRREAYEATGGYEAAFTGMYEDQVFMSKLFLEQRVWIDSRTWIRYRQHAASCVARSFRTATNAGRRRRFLRWLRRHLAGLERPNVQLTELLTRELRENRVLRRRERRRRLAHLLRPAGRH